MGRKNMQISVIIPVYNAEPYLKQCVDSIICQTMSDFELICIDDGSIDSSREILAEYAVKDTRIKVITQENQFAGVARNNGLKMAVGEYIIFLDADDFFEPNMLEKAYRRIKATNADVCVFKAYSFDQGNKVIQKMPWTCQKELCPSNEVFSIKDNPRYIFKFTSPVPWTKMYRRSFLKENRLQFQKIHSSNDVSFVLTSLAVANKITLVDEYLLYYRINVKTTLQASRGKEALLFLQALTDLKEQLIKRKVYQESRTAYINFVLGCCEYNESAIQDEGALYELYSYLRGEGKCLFDLNSVEKEDIFEKPFFYEWKRMCQLDWKVYIRRKRIVSSELWKGIAFIPKKIYGGINCYFEYGMIYTLKHLRSKI